MCNIVNAINILKQYGASSVDVCCVHPILTNNGATRIYAAGANKIIGTNSLSSDTSRVSIAKSIATANKWQIFAESVYGKSMTLTLIL